MESVRHSAPLVLPRSGTIVENVLFGAEPCDDARLDDALERCCLGPDLAALPDGRHTLVGPAGVQLSGGQKARVALDPGPGEKVVMFSRGSPVISLESPRLSTTSREFLLI